MPSEVGALHVRVRLDLGDRPVGDVAFHHMEVRAVAFRPGFPHQFLAVGAAGRLVLRDADSGAVIGEVDLGANIHLKNDFDLTVYFGNQGVATPTGTRT